jgi:hypothetical protein
MTNGVDDNFNHIVNWLYRDGQGAKLLDKAINALKTMVDGDGEVKSGGLEKVSKGALLMLKRQLKDLEELRDKKDDTKEMIKEEDVIMQELEQLDVD